MKTNCVLRLAPYGFWCSAFNPCEHQASLIDTNIYSRNLLHASAASSPGPQVESTEGSAQQTVWGGWSGVIASTTGYQPHANCVRRLAVPFAVCTARHRRVGKLTGCVNPIISGLVSIIHCSLKTAGEQRHADSTAHRVDGRTDGWMGWRKN